MQESLVNEILASLKSAQKICLVMHQRPDADSIGAAAAFGIFLTARGIPFVYYCQTDLPRESTFFGIDLTEVLDEQDLKNLNSDLIITFDAGDLKHAGLEKLQEVTRSYKKLPFIINFDHHLTNVQFGNLNIIDPKSASTTEVLYHFFNLARFPINTKIASCLLAGVLVDTDHFLNPATTASSLAITSELMMRGVALPQIRQLLFERRDTNSLRLVGKILARLQKNDRYAIAITHVTEDDLKEYQMTFDDLEGVANILNSIADVKAMFLIKAEQDTIKISMRTTKNDVNVGRLAELLGGGGHKKAAGFTIKGTLQKQGNRVRVI